MGIKQTKIVTDKKMKKTDIARCHDLYFRQCVSTKYPVNMQRLIQYHNLHSYDNRKYIEYNSNKVYKIFDSIYDISNNINRDRIKQLCHKCYVSIFVT